MAAHWGNGVEDAVRLEAALERIARARRAKAEADKAESDIAAAEKERLAAVDVSMPHADLAADEAARRLDGVIAHLRSALGKDMAD